MQEEKLNSAHFLHCDEALLQGGISKLLQQTFKTDLHLCSFNPHKQLSVEDPPLDLFDLILLTVKSLFSVTPPKFQSLINKRTTCTFYLLTVTLLWNVTRTGSHLQPDVKAPAPAVIRVKHIVSVRCVSVRCVCVKERESECNLTPSCCV